MQLTMAYSNETSLAMPPTFRQPKYYQPTKPQQQYRKQYNNYPQPPPKSQPFDPEDLRRRLHVVIAEREAQNERRQRQRVDALPAKQAQVERERDMAAAAAAATQFHLERRSEEELVMMTKTTSINRWSGSLSMSRSFSTREEQQAKLRHRNSMMAALPSSGAIDSTDGSSGYRHVPEQAAAQFSRTTTSMGMRHQYNHDDNTSSNKFSKPINKNNDTNHNTNHNDNKSSNTHNKNNTHNTTSGNRDKSLVHTLSRAALRLYTEGLSSAERRAIETSITPGRQRNVLKRSRERKAEQQLRNQFQEPSSPLTRTTTWRRRHSRASSSEEESGPIGALADLHLHTYASQERERRRDSGGEVHSSEETLVDAATANEHRIDWSQSDEIPPHEQRSTRRRMSFPISAGTGGSGFGVQTHMQHLLRKTSSILSMRKNSTGSNNEGDEDKNAVGAQHHEQRERQQRQRQNLRIVTIREEIDEQAEAAAEEADEGSTPMSPNSSRSGRFGIWGRLRRGSAF